MTRPKERRRLIVPPKENERSESGTNEWLANEGLIEIKQQWWNVKFLLITALKQTAEHVDQSGCGSAV